MRFIVFVFIMIVVLVVIWYGLVVVLNFVWVLDKVK